MEAEELKKVTLRLKKDKVKINATLSALFSRLSLNPVKTLDQINKAGKNSHSKIFYVDLLVDPQGNLKLELKQNPDTLNLKELVDNGRIDQRKLREYAEKTLEKSLAHDLEGRLRELKGVLRSMKIE